MDTFQKGWCRVCLLLALLAACHGSHGTRGRPAGPSVLRPLVLLETEQGLSLGAGPLAAAGVVPGAVPADDAALMELDQLLNLFQSKAKRSQDPVDKGLTRDLVAQVLQPGGAGMWFGPRLGRRRRRSAPSAAAAVMARRRKRSLQQDGEVDNDIPWTLAELLKELQGPKRSPSGFASPTPCDSADINCLLASIATGSTFVPSEQQQHPRSEGNLVNFTPRLGRESGEQEQGGDAGSGPGSDSGDAASGSGFSVDAATSRQLRTDNEPQWGFSPRLGRRLLPPGAVDVHDPADAPPPASQSSRPRSRGGRSARSAEAAANVSADAGGSSSQEHTRL